jgi:regulatory protein
LLSGRIFLDEDTFHNLKKITSIEIQAKNKDRVNVFLDNEFAFGLYQDVLLKAGIGKGDELSPERIEQILVMENRKKAMNKAYRLLAYRARSKKELVDRLSREGYAASIINDVIAELERLELMNDQVFAIQYTRTRMVSRPVGAFMLQRELAEKGIPPEFVQIGIEEAFKEKSEREVAVMLARKKKDAMKNVEETKARKRVSDFLIRRGFHWDIVKDILESWDSLE